MKKVEAIVATDKIINGIKITRSSLESMAEQSKKYYIPVTLEHDIRNPPIGRVVSAEVIKLPEGGYGLKNTIELFDNPDELEFSKDNSKTIQIEKNDIETISVSYDDLYSQKRDEILVSELSELTDDIKQPEKRSLEPISTLIIFIGGSIIGSIFSGFFGKIGSDAYDKLKNTLIGYYGRNSSDEQILDIYSTVKDGCFEVHIIVDTSETNLRNFFEKDFQRFDEKIGKYKDETNISKIVLKYENGKYFILYALRSDAVPLESNLKEL